MSVKSMLHGIVKRLVHWGSSQDEGVRLWLAIPLSDLARLQSQIEPAFQPLGPWRGLRQDDLKKEQRTPQS